MNKRIRGAFVVAATMLCLTGCGSYNDQPAFQTSKYSTDGAYVNSAEEFAYDDYDSYDDRSEADIVKSTMMIAKDVSLSVDVENLESFQDDLYEKVSGYDGYFESSSIDNYSSEYQECRYSSYTIRIPAEHLDDFLTVIDGVSTVTSQTVDAEDVSLDYVDVKAHIGALETEKENLLRLMEQTESVSDMLEIEERLADVQARLDSYNGQKNLLEGRVSYSTVRLQAREERNIDHPIRRAFNVNFKEKMLDGMEEAVQTLVNIIAAIPVIIIVTAFAIFFIWIVRKVWRRVFKKDRNIKYVMTPVILEDTVKEAPKNKIAGDYHMADNNKSTNE